MKQTRRRFLKAAGASVLAVPFIAPSSILGNNEKAAPSDRVTLGHIGVGGRGGSLLGGFRGLRDAQPVAFADPFRSRRERWAKQLGGKAYNDFRELLVRDDIDAVVVATQDHWHVPITIAAARAGKDMYVEKPLGISIRHDQAARAEVKKHKRVFQYGTQQRSSAHCRFGCELVRSGYVGKVHKIEVIAPNGARGGSTTEIPVPDDLDYDMWLGPAPTAPYTKDRTTRAGAWHFYDYAIGFIAGWGAHPLDILQWGYESQKAGPVDVQGTGVIPTEGLFNTVVDWDVTYKYGNGLTVTLKPGGDSTKFIGEKGWVQVRRGGIDANPKSLLKTKLGDGDVRLQTSPRQDQNFIDCVKSRNEPVSPIDDAFYSDIAIRTGRKIRWDQDKEMIIGDADAAKRMSRPLRAPWTL